MFLVGREWCLVNKYGVPSLAIVARRPFEANIGPCIVIIVRLRRIEEGYRARDAVQVELERRFVSKRFARGMKAFAAIHPG